MPIYSFKCSKCGMPDDIVLPIPDRDKPRLCSCGGAMVRVMAPTHFRMPKPGRERVTDTLNYEYNKPGLRDARSTAALVKGLDYKKETIGRGFAAGG